MRTWPLVGRRDELEYVRSSLDEGRGVLVTGLAGVGKSRLTSTTAASLAEQGWTVHRCAGTPELARIPFGACASLPGSSGPSDLLDRFRAVAGALAADERAVLVVEDVHDLDEASIAFVHHVVGATPVRLLLTARSGVPVAPSLAALAREGPLRRLELQPLSRDEVRDLLGLVLDGAVDAAAAGELWRRTRGNPLFVHELVLDALDQGDLVDRDGTWRLLGLRPGDRVHEIVAARLATLDADERAAAELLALAEPIGLGVLERVVGLAAMESLERRGLATWSTDDRRQQLRLVHPVYGESIRADLGPATHRRHRIALIRAVEADPCRRRDDRLRLATWRVDAGEVGDVEALVDAATDLLTTVHQPLKANVVGTARESELPAGFLASAERLARTALEHGGGYRAAVVLVKALQHQGRHAEIGALALPSDRVDRPEARVESAIVSSFALVAIGELDRAIEQYEHHLALLPPEHRERLLIGRLTLFILVGRQAAAAAAVAELDGVVPAEPRDRLMLGALRAQVLSGAGRCDDALAVLDETVSRIDGSEDAEAFTAAFIARLIVLLRAGRVAEALSLAATAESVGPRVGESEEVAALELLLAGVTLIAGRLETARRHAAASASAFGRVDSIGQRRSALAFQAHVTAMQGRSDEATSLLAAAAAEPVRPHSMRVAFERAEAWTAACGGHHAAAVRGLLEVARVVRDDENVADELIALHDLVRLGEPALVVERVHEIAAAFQGPLGALVRDHAEHLIAGDGDGLDDVATRAGELGFSLVAAETWAQAARAHDAAGRRSSAAASRRLAAEWRERCDGAATPALRDNRSPSLTRREREVAELAVTGMSDQQIADELVVSVRTVETHLGNAYGKLGVRNRGELTALLATRDAAAPPASAPRS